MARNDEIVFTIRGAPVRDTVRDSTSSGSCFYTRSPGGGGKLREAEQKSVVDVARIRLIIQRHRMVKCPQLILYRAKNIRSKSAVRVKHIHERLGRSTARSDVMSAKKVSSNRARFNSAVAFEKATSGFSFITGESHQNFFLVPLRPPPPR